MRVEGEPATDLYPTDKTVTEYAPTSNAFNCKFAIRRRNTSCVTRYAVGDPAGNEPTTLQVDHFPDIQSIIRASQNSNDRVLSSSPLPLLEKWFARGG